MKSPSLPGDSRPPAKTVHLLIGGRTICGMTDLPKDWEEGVYWVAIDDRGHATCPQCRTGLDLSLPPNRAMKGSTRVGDYLAANSNHPMPLWMEKYLLERLPAPKIHPSSGTHVYRDRLLDQLAKAAHHAKWAGKSENRDMLDRVWHKMGNGQKEEYRRIVKDILAAAAAEPDGLACLRILREG